jgi:hypothetical protein
MKRPQNQQAPARGLRAAGAGLALLAALAVPAAAQPLGGVTFRDIATAANGITYRRTPSTIAERAAALRRQGVSNLGTLLLEYPLKSNGAAGVVLLDYDGDGDLDLYVTDGPGADNSLYANQLAQGRFALELVPGAAGAAAHDQDSTGACFGDTDNDGDPDLLVLGRGEPKRFFENRAGAFVDVSAASAIGTGSFNSSSCAMGDVNGDGLLDVFIGNTFDWATKAAIVVEPWALNEYNQLYVNQGGNRFADVSAGSGLQNFRDVSWSAVLFDYDRDGDIDILVANDQGAIAPGRYGGVNRGFVRIYRNDGNLRFTDVTFAAGLREVGGYMGFAVADYDGNGAIDLYVSNVGDWLEVMFGLSYTLGDQTSRWFLNNGNGTFSDPGVGALITSGWSWGASAFDYDNDGDFDIVAYGGLDAGPLVDRSNPGTLLNNDGKANFRLDAAALAGAADHVRSNGHGLATGDLNGDGYEDIVSVSDVSGAPFFPVIPYPFRYSSVYDGRAGFIPTWLPQPDGSWAWSGVDLLPGSLAIEINSGGNRNGWVNVRTVGTVGIATEGRSNRDGIGAVVRFTPLGKATASQPILGGSSHSSQDSLTAHFGLGRAPRGRLEVEWQGGVRNRLYNVRAGELVRFPEIPCDFAASWPSRGAYVSCVDRALTEIQGAGLLTTPQTARFRASALRAYDDAH